MTLLDTLKSLLGLESSDGRRRRDEEVGVTVEREASPEPDASTEEAVKGAETGTAGEEEATEEEAAEEEAAEEEAAEEVAEEADLGTDESTDVLEGIGSAYADRLSDAGVETVADLAAADAADLAGETDIGESRLETWIERARDR